MPTSSEVNGNRSQSPRAVHSPSSLRRSNDELRKNIALLKRELENERIKSKQTHRDKIAEIKKLRDKNDEEKNIAINILTEKIKLENEQDMNKLKDILLKEKQSDIKQLLKFKDEELKVTKRLLHDEKQRALKDSEERHRKYLTSLSLKEGVTEQERKLRRELIEVRKQKQAIDDVLKAKALEDTDNNDTIRRLKDEFEHNQNQMSKDHKKETLKLTHELNSTQKLVHDKEQLLSQAESDLKTLEREKIVLNDRLQEQNAKAESLAVEFKKEKRIASEKDPSTYQKQIKELGRKNFELGMTIRRLEDREKDLKEQVGTLRHSERKQSAKALEYSEMLAHLKKTYTMQRARLLSNHAKEMLDKNKEIKQILQENEHDQSNTDNENYDNVAHLSEVIQQLQKENLRLEKQLASPRSSKTSISEEDLNTIEGQKLLLTNENRMLKESVQNLEISMEEMSRQLKELLEKEAQLNSIIGQKNDYCSLMLTQLEDAEKKLSIQMQTVQTEEEKQKSMENMLSAMQDEMIDIQSVLSKKKEQCLFLTTELTQKKEDNSILQKKIYNIERANNDIGILRKQNNDLLDNLKLKQSKIHDLQNRVDYYVNMQDDLHSLEEQLSELEVNRNKYARDAETRQNEIENLQKEREQQKQIYEERLYNLHNEMKELEASYQEIEANKRILLEELHTVRLKTSKPPTVECSSQTDYTTPSTQAMRAVENMSINRNDEDDNVSPDSLSPPLGESRDADMPLAAEYLQSSSLQQDGGDSNSISSRLSFPIPSLSESNKPKDFTSDTLISHKVDPPSSVILERRLSDSILLRWSLPRRYPSDDRIKGFTIYQNGEFKQLALGAKRTNALVIDLDFNMPSSFSVRTVTGSGLISRDSNLVILSTPGKDTGNALLTSIGDSRKEDEIEDESTTNNNVIVSSNRIEISDDFDLSAIIEETAEELREYETQIISIEELSETESSDVLEIMQAPSIKSLEIITPETKVIDSDKDIIDEVPDLPHDGTGAADDCNNANDDIYMITPRSIGNISTTDIEEDSIESEFRIQATESISSDMKVSSLSSFHFTDDDQASDRDLDSVEDIETAVPASRPEKKPSKSVTVTLLKTDHVINQEEATKLESDSVVKPASEEEPGAKTESVAEEVLTVKPIPDRSIEIRIFIALFSYDPKIMSPNDDGSDTELDFKEGDLIKIFGDVDDDGFYLGEINGKEGLVPSNMIQEVDLDLIQSSKESSPRRNNEISASSDRLVINNSIDSTTELSRKTMVALYDYDPSISSPNVDAEVELAFHAGDILYVHGEMDEDGFYVGERQGKKGLVPSNFLQETSSQHETNHELQVGYHNEIKQFSSTISPSSSISSTSSPKDKRKRRFYHAGKKLLAKLKGNK